MAPKKSIPKVANKSDLIAARAELKQFRHDVSILKRKGLLDKALDARSIKPSKYLKSQIKRFGNVLRGEASPVKVSKQAASQLKTRGFVIKNGRAVVPHMPGEKVRSARGSFKITTMTKGGGKIERLDLALDPDDINQWIDDLRNNRFPIGRDEELTITFRGHSSGAGFGKLARGGLTPQEQLANFLEGYRLVDSAMNGHQDDQEVIDGIVIYKVTKGNRPPSSGEVERRDEETLERYRVRARRARQLRLGRMSEKTFEEYTKGRAATEKERRANMSDEKREAYKAKAKARAQASRDKKKKG